MLFSVPLPCIVSDWSEWSKPDVTGTIYRHRMMTRPPLNGGKECPELLQMKKGWFIIFKLSAVDMCSW